MNPKDLTDKELADAIRQGLEIDDATVDAIIEATDRGLAVSVDMWGGLPLREENPMNHLAKAFRIRPKLSIKITRELQ